MDKIKKVAQSMGIITVEDMERYTALELIMMITNKMNDYSIELQDLSDKVQYLLNEGTLAEVIQIFDEWLQDGTFDMLINQSALKEVNDRIDETNAQLSEITKIIHISPTGINDTLLVNDSIGKLEADGGGTLQLTQGVFNLDYIHLARKVNIRGVGTSTILKVNTGVSTPFITFKDGYANELKISDLIIDGNRNNNSCSDIIYLHKPSLPVDLDLYDAFISIENVTIENGFNNGIRLGNNIRECDFSKLVIRNNGGIGLHNEFGSDNRFNKISSFNNGGDGFKEYGSANRFVDCKAFMNGNSNSIGKGFNLKCAYNTFTACEAQENYGDGFFIDGCTTISLVNCISSTNSRQSPSKYDGFNLINSNRVKIISSIANNFVETSTGESFQRNGVTIDETTRLCEIDVIVTNNVNTYQSSSTYDNNLIIINNEVKHQIKLYSESGHNMVKFMNNDNSLIRFMVGENSDDNSFRIEYCDVKTGAWKGVALSLDKDGNIVLGKDGTAIGFFGNYGGRQQSLNSPCNNLDSCVALTNQIREALLTFGLCK